MNWEDIIKKDSWIYDDPYYPKTMARFSELSHDVLKDLLKHLKENIQTVEDLKFIRLVEKEMEKRKISYWRVSHGVLKQLNNIQLKRLYDNTQSHPGEKDTKFIMEIEQEMKQRGMEI